MASSPPILLPPHPSLSYYRGDTHLRITLPTRQSTGSTKTTANGESSPGSASSTEDAPSCMTQTVGIIKLHHVIFPPAPVGQLGEVADEHYATQLASAVGLEELRLNWRTLFAVLFPCFLPGDPLPSSSPAARTEGVPCNVAVLGPPQSSSQQQPIAPFAADGHATLEHAVEACVSAHVCVADYNGLREPGVMDRIYYSFISVLRFFGWKVHDEQRGVLDRHRGWRERYRALEAAFHASAEVLNPTEQDRRNGMREYLLAMPPQPPSMDSFDFYTVAILRMLQCLLSVGFLALAVGLAEFLLDEMAAQRLLFLYEFADKQVLPCIEACVDVDAGHRKRLRRKLHKLTHSDSD